MSVFTKILLTIVIILLGGFLITILGVGRDQGAGGPGVIIRVAIAAGIFAGVRSIWKRKKVA
jgi:hypothetical protein